MLAVVYSTFAGDTILKARAARQRIDTALGYPSPGRNVATGELAPPGGPGWTVTHCAIVRVPDPNHAGEFLVLVGPIPPALAVVIGNLPNPPTVVDVPPARWRKGRVYAVRIAGWANGLPTTAEDPVDDDEDAEVT